MYCGASSRCPQVVAGIHGSTDVSCPRSDLSSSASSLFSELIVDLTDRLATFHRLVYFSLYFLASAIFSALEMRGTRTMQKAKYNNPWGCGGTHQICTPRRKAYVFPLTNAVGVDTLDRVFSRSKTTVPYST